MPPFKSPDPPYPYQLASQIAAVDEWFTHRNVPVSTDGRLLLASWNIANLGAQKRSDKDLKLIAHIMQRFDLIAVQEVNDNYAPFARAVELMDGDFDWIINDTGGNRERLGFVYRRDKVTPGRLFAEVALRELDFPKRDIVVAYEKGGEQRIEVYYQLKFRPFDRNPFVGTFEAGNLDFTIANVHLYFGAFKNASSVEERAKYARRVMEIFALSDWAKKRRKSNKTYDRDIALIGDMNVPEMHPDDAAFRALKKSGLTPMDFYTKTGGANLAGTKTYDQLAITPGDLKDRVLDFSVFDFDNAIFKGKWKQLEQELAPKKAVSKFNGYVKHHVSDHRPIWMELDIS